MQLESNITGWNNESGIMYTEMNGLRQYKGDRIYPRSNNIYPMYKNIKNTELFLKTSNNGKNFFNKGGLSKLPEPEYLQYGKPKSFQPEPQVKGQPSRLQISKEIQTLSKKERKNQPEKKVVSSEQQTLNKFKSFLNSLQKMPPNKKEKKTKGNYFKGAIDLDLPPDNLI